MLGQATPSGCQPKQPSLGLPRPVCRLLFLGAGSLRHSLQPAPTLFFLSLSFSFSHVFPFSILFSQPQRVWLSYHTPLTPGPEPLTFALSCLCVCPSSPGPAARPVRFQLTEGSYVFNGYKIIDNNATSNTNNNNCRLLGTYQA